VHRVAALSYISRPGGKFPKPLTEAIRDIYAFLCLLRTFETMQRIYETQSYIYGPSFGQFEEII